MEDETIVELLYRRDEGALEELLDLVMDEKLPNDRAILLDYTKEKLL